MDWSYATNERSKVYHAMPEFAFRTRCGLYLATSNWTNSRPKKRLCKKCARARR